MNVFTTYALRWTLGDLNINIIHKNRYQVLLNWFQPYQTPMWGKQQIFLYPCAVTVIILSKYLVGLNYRIFLFRFRVAIMTTLDHAVEEGCRRILLEEEEGEGGGRREGEKVREGGREEEEEGYISCFHFCC